MNLIANGQVAATVAGMTTVAHSGSSLSFGDLVITTSDSQTLPLHMGPATLDGDEFNGGTQLDTACGITTTRFQGWFNGDGTLMNMTVIWMSPTENCNNFELRSEMHRDR